ncbi:hypothetical protein CFP56_002358 [Quercus suber]|uniref:Uncharacterized protein n=1 Tax=Quercus suber TaxID=58331 RepID=A0AAW0ILB0_QUESU
MGLMWWRVSVVVGWVIKGDGVGHVHGSSDSVGCGFVGVEVGHGKLVSGLMGRGLCVGAAVEISEVMPSGWRESWRDCVWWFRWGSCSGGDPWVASRVIGGSAVISELQAV